jgi:putative ABC transport system permease protein
VQKMVVLQGTRVVMLGVVLGLVAAYFLTRFLGALLYGVAAVDALVFVAMAAMLLAVGLLASWLPARRASLVDPIESLRAD